MNWYFCQMRKILKCTKLIYALGCKQLSLKYSNTSAKLRCQVFQNHFVWVFAFFLFWDEDGIMLKMTTKYIYVYSRATYQWKQFLQSSQNNLLSSLHITAQQSERSSFQNLAFSHTYPAQPALQLCSMKTSPAQKVIYLENWWLNIQAWINCPHDLNSQRVNRSRDYFACVSCLWVCFNTTVLQEKE